MTLYYVPQYITTQLSVSGGIDDTQTTGIVLQSITGIDHTKPGILAITWSDPLDTTKVEYLFYTSINNSTKELQGVTRGQEGYSAKNHVNGAVIAWPLSKSHINNMNDILLTVSGGWSVAGETWTYASADDPTYTFTVAGDLSTKYSVGMRIKLTQTTEKYFIITKVVYSSPNTTITVYGGTDYDLSSATITDNYYSYSKSPFGFPTNPDKWFLELRDTSDQTQSTPTNGTWYNIGSLSIDIPIGSWKVEYSCVVNPFTAGGATGIFQETSLSTSNSSVTDLDFLTLTAASSVTEVNQTIYKTKNLTTTSKTTYYLIDRTLATLTAIRHLASNYSIPTVVKITSNYL